jgi:hypothetical protein
VEGPGGAGACDVVVAPDGGYLITGGGHLIDTRTLDIVARAPTRGEQLHRIHMVPDSRRAFMTNSADQSITVIEFGAESLLATGDAPQQQRPESAPPAGPERPLQAVPHPPSGSGPTP